MRIAASGEDAGGLRAENRLAAAQDHQVGAHLEVLRQVVGRRDVRRRIDQDRHARLLAHLDELGRQHHVGTGPVRAFLRHRRTELHLVLHRRDRGDHCRAVADALEELLARSGFDNRHPRRAVGAVVVEAVHGLDEALASRPGRVGQRLHLGGVGAGETGRGPERHRRKAPGGDERGLAAKQRGDARIGRLEQIAQVDEEPVGLSHRRDDFTRHARSAQARDVLVRGQMRSDAEQAGVDVVAIRGVQIRGVCGLAACRGPGGLRGGGHARRGGDAGDAADADELAPIERWRRTGVALVVHGGGPSGAFAREPGGRTKGESVLTGRVVPRRHDHSANLWDSCPLAASLRAAECLNPCRGANGTKWS